MNYNQNNSLVEQNLLQLQTIDKQLSVLMCKYKQSINDYIQSLNNTTKTKNDFSKLRGKTFWGSSASQEGVVDNIGECVNMCLNDTSCSGATYNKTNNYCWSRVGDGIISVSNNDDYAIIPIKEKNLKTMQSINQEIINLQNQKMNIIKNMGSSVNILSEENNETKKQIDNLLLKLNKEKQIINEMLQQSDNLNKEYDDTSLIVNSNNIKYSFLWLIFIVLVVITVGIFISLNTKNNTYSGGSKKMKNFFNNLTFFKL